MTGAILAGGAGTRMAGRDKGLVLLDGRPLVAWVVEALRAQVARIIIVANRNPGRYADYGRVISDAQPDAFGGPLAGLAAALATTPQGWLLSVPVDCVAPPSDLAARLAAAPGPAGVAVAHDGERRQPLFALYRPGLANAAATAAAAGQGVWQWQDAVRAVEVDFADRRAAFANINTPQALAARQARARHAG
jgi:molybdenum cofactor guanylyltransferase